MKTIFESVDAQELLTRLTHLRGDTPRQWGIMTPTQTLAHCSAGLAMATGELRPPRAFIGRILGPVIKSLAVGNDEPMRRNSPTAKELVIADCKSFVAEQADLAARIDRVATAGPSGCTSHPHPFFGKLSPAEWGNIMYKHLDHHLRQFGV